jgi:hypothetical protein
MERTDWLDGGFTSLHAELAEIELMAGRAVVDENATAAG